MSTPEVIVGIGVDGGTLALYGYRDPHRGWRFARGMTDPQPLWLFDDEDGPDLDDERHWVKTWPDAMALLDRYPWALLNGLEVHPEFRERIWIEIKYRLYGLNDGRIEDRRQQWARLCTRSAPVMVEAD